MAHADIYSIEWCDMVFVEKNKTYGAFDLRKYSSKRQVISLIASTVLFISAILILGHFNRANVAGSQKVIMGGYTTLTDIARAKDKIINEIKSITEKQPEFRKTIRFTPPVITRDDSVRDGEEIRSQGELLLAKGLISTFDNERGSDDPDAPMPVTDKQIAGEETGEKPLIGIQQPPEFPGGMKALYQYFSDNLRYPKSATNSGIQGKVFIQFVVSKNGKITDIKILKGVDESLDGEAIRLIKGMPAWKPGKNNGKPVAAYFSLPITFKIQDL